MSYQQNGAYQQGQASRPQGPPNTGTGAPVPAAYQNNGRAPAPGPQYTGTIGAPGPATYQTTYRVPAPGPRPIQPGQQGHGLRSHPTAPIQLSPPQPGHSTSQKNVAGASVFPSSTNFPQTTKAADPESGQVTGPRSTFSVLQYLRFHPVTGPYFRMLDRWEPEVYRRILKEPKLVKLGLKTNKDQNKRGQYAWDKFWGRERHEGPGFRQKDYFGRVTNRDKDERYISAWDAKLKELVVMSTDEVFYEKNDSNWTRTRMNTLAPFAIRVAGWCAWSSKPGDLNTSRRVFRRIIGGLLLCLPIIPADMFASHGQNDGYFEPLFYSLHGYAKIPRNDWECHDRFEIRNGQRVTQPRPRVNQRTMGPAMLCRISWPEEDESETSRDEDAKVARASVEIVRTENWDVRQTGEPFPEYVFIAYIMKQFPKEKEADLHMLAIKAARDAGVDHYWIACSCMADATTEIYHISDIVRASKSVAIAINGNMGLDSLALLQQFGERVWTLPELLLAPQTDNIFHVYSQKGTMFFTRYQMVRDIWTDAETSRQLVEHFQGSLELSRLELSVIALKSFYSRERGFRYAGDREYALMGLLRQRCIINPDYTEFEAFANLSLLADSDSLLERLICLQPVTRSQKWNDMEDAYGASLWDIYPLGQISGIGHGHPDAGGQMTQRNAESRDTVIVDGLSAAKVRWKSFAPVRSLKRTTIIRSIIEMILRWSSYFFLIGIILIALANGAADLIGIGVILMIIGLIGVAMTPELVVKRAGGKIWSNEPWLFGIEGYCNIGEIETAIFGMNLGHLKWAPFGSPLSRHEPNQYGDVVGTDPMTYPDVKDYVDKLRRTKEARVFMLVCTKMMTVTLFESTRPPIAFLFAGSEGGMQRTIGVSYDWTTNTLYRECVLRMDTTLLDRAARVQRVRLGLRRND